MSLLIKNKRNVFWFSTQDYGRTILRGKSNESSLHLKACFASLHSPPAQARATPLRDTIHRHHPWSTHRSPSPLGHTPKNKLPQDRVLHTRPPSPTWRSVPTSPGTALNYNRNLGGGFPQITEPRQIFTAPGEPIIFPPTANTHFRIGHFSGKPPLSLPRVFFQV